jgi:phage regulator Rha-like protein
MSSPVEIYNDELRSGTWIISEGFERLHYDVLKLIKKHGERFLRLEDKRNSNHFITRRVPAKKAGRPVDEIMLNKKQALFLGTLFRNTERVLDFKEKLANDFVEQENLLKNLLDQQQSVEWISNRANGKLIRREETNTIKDFVEYAQCQGSVHADRYYSVLSQCVNNNLFTFNGKFKNKRNAMSAVQLMDVGFAEGVVSKGLIEGMAKGLHYKDIYKLVRDRIVTIAELHGKSEVISQQLRID